MKILVFPKDVNPYQDLLYSDITDSNITVTYLKLLTSSHTLGLLSLPFQIIMYRLKGYNIFHLHWLYTFQLTQTSKFFHNIFFKTFFSLYLLCFIAEIKFTGYKLVWTIHDITPHERLFIDDLFVTKIISSMADICIVHTNHIARQLLKLKISHKKIKVIPHGSYTIQYKNNIERAQARSKVGLKDNDFTYLFLGQIREYKGIPELLKSFKKIIKLKSFTKLVIAGKCSDGTLKNLLDQAKIDMQDKLYLQLSNIPDDDIQIYMNAADVVVFPFRRVTTSGSLLLALSFGKPVIYPKEFFTELPDNIGYGYENVDDLPKIMENAIHDTTLTQKGVNAKLYADQFSWPEIAHATLAVYNSLI